MGQTSGSKYIPLPYTHPHPELVILSPSQGHSKGGAKGHNPLYPIMFLEGLQGIKGSYPAFELDYPPGTAQLWKSGPGLVP